MATLIRHFPRSAHKVEAAAPVVATCSPTLREPFSLRFPAVNPRQELTLALSAREVHELLGAIPLSELLDQFGGDAERAGRWVGETAVALGQRRPAQPEPE